MVSRYGQKSSKANSVPIKLKPNGFNLFPGHNLRSDLKNVGHIQGQGVDSV
jgi:hypothetical protein